MFFFSKQTNKQSNQYLVAGLGNIGVSYAQTRHNIGFDIVEAIIKKHKLTIAKKKLLQLSVWDAFDRQLFFIRPSTFMNNSGHAIAYWLNKHKIPAKNLFVITDDLYLPFGKIKIRAKGSAGGHNGLKSIENHLNTPDYARLKFGIGKTTNETFVDYVLSKWTKEQEKALPELIQKSVAIVEYYAQNGIDACMNKFNSNKA